MFKNQNMYKNIHAETHTNTPEDTEIETSFENPQKGLERSAWLAEWVQYMYWIYTPPCRDYYMSNKEFL